MSGPDSPGNFFREEVDTEAVQNKLDSLCKPPGSLGSLESVAAKLCSIQNTLTPATRPRHVTVFAADHGVVCEGVTAWPSEVTAAVVTVMQQERTASGVFARSLGCGYEVVDVGLLKPLDGPGSSVIDVARRRSTGNLLREPAMSQTDFEHAWNVGVECAARACAAGRVLLIGGEMGIGNTTAASCLIGLLTDDANPKRLVGRGAGIGDAMLSRKQQVVSEAIDRVRALGTVTSQDIACEVGGLEIVALAGFYVEGARLGATLLIDGLIATSAALLAESLHPSVRNSMIAGHCSTEPGHTAALQQLNLDPILDLNMRLGEATGALAALPLLDLAAAMMNDMATLSELELP